MLSRNMQIRIELACYATAGSLFSLMINDKYRGGAFTWDRFADLVKGHCKDQAYMTIPSYVRRKREIDEYAEDCAYKIARDMIKNAGLLKEA